MHFTKKHLITLAVAFAAVATPLTAFAVAAPPRPKFCSTKLSSSPIFQSICETYDFASQINDGLTALAGRVDGIDSRVGKLEQQNSDLSAQVSALNDRVTKLEATPSPSTSPSPTTSPSTGGACDNGQGNGGYPMVWCNAPQDSMVDSWGFYTRESPSYTAWAASSHGYYVPYGLGNCNQWPAAARARGITVDSNPEVGNAAVWPGGPYGECMIVEKIQGTTVIVSSMNVDNAGHYGTADWPISSLQFIHFQKSSVTISN